MAKLWNWVQHYTCTPYHPCTLPLSLALLTIISCSSFGEYPSPWMIFICLTTVLFPDSPAPAQKNIKPHHQPDIVNININQPPPSYTPQSHQINNTHLALSRSFIIPHNSSVHIVPTLGFHPPPPAPSLALIPLAMFTDFTDIKVWWLVSPQDIIILIHKFRLTLSIAQHSVYLSVSGSLSLCSGSRKM